ncbi:MAG: rhodanese-like domain-containing protein [Bacteroidales bacterium]|jgi:rhodanese-related sulfurtransferase|nr:rhodanese-like domain-containing protein [Bacteroidales bacterium]
MKQLKFLALILIPLGIIIAAVPADRVSQVRLTPEELLQEAGAGVQFITPDAIADMLVQKDPSLRLIDVRTPEEFDAYSMPGAVNVPLSNLLADEYKDILNQDAYVNVFYSNGSVYANQAWMITRQLGYENNFVLEGGLNYWFGNILSPQEPTQTSPDEEFARYDFRKSAAAALGGGGVVSTEASSPAVKAVKPVVTARAKKKPAGGC